MVGTLDDRDWTIEGITIGVRGFRSSVSMSVCPQRFLCLLSFAFSVAIEEVEEASPPLTGMVLFLFLQRVCEKKKGGINDGM